MTGASDDTASIWELATGKRVMVLKGHGNTVRDTTYSPDGQYIATASDDNKILLWDTKTGTSIREFRGHDASVQSVGFSPDGKFLITSSNDETARIWDVHAGTVIRSLRHPDRVNCAVFSPDGRTVVTGSADKNARIWDVETGKEVAVLRAYDDGLESVGYKRSVTDVGDKDGVTNVAFSRDGKLLLTGSTDSASRIWDVSAGMTLVVLRGHVAPVLGGGFSPDSKRVVTSSADKTARLWDLAASEPLLTIQVGEKRRSFQRDDFSQDGDRIIVNRGIFDPAGNRVLIAATLCHTEAKSYNNGMSSKTSVCDKHLASILGAENGEKITSVPENLLAISADWKRIALPSSDGTVTIRDTDSGFVITALSGEEVTIDNAVFSPDGKHIATTASATGILKVWDANSGQRISVYTVHNGSTPTRIAAFSPDGKHIITTSSKNMAKVWDWSAGKEILALPHQHGVLDAAFSLDGRLILTGSDNAYLWEADTGAMIGTLRGNRPVRSVAFSRDATHVLTSSGAEAYLWDLGTLKKATALPEGDSVTLSPDGKRVLTTSSDSVRIWRLLALQELVQDTKRILPRCLIQSQRERSFLDPEPPAWCIEMDKWPYQTQEWKEWLRFKRAKANPPLPDTLEWQPWIAAHH